MGLAAWSGTLASVALSVHLSVLRGLFWRHHLSSADTVLERLLAAASSAVLLLVLPSGGVGLLCFCTCFSFLVLLPGCPGLLPLEFPWFLPVWSVLLSHLLAWCGFFCLCTLDEDFRIRVQLTHQPSLQIRQVVPSTHKHSCLLGPQWIKQS